MRISSWFSLLVFFIYLSLGLSGCYTQLLIRNHGERPQEVETAYNSHPQSSGDTLAPIDSTTFVNGPGNSLSNRNTNVTVNNFYSQGDTYRGYSNFTWDYPLLSFSYYSSRYQNYSDPYWWRGSGSYRDRYYNCYNDPWPNSSHPQYHNPHPNENFKPESMAGNSQYRSPERVFIPPPDYPSVQKGRRTQNIQAPIATTPESAQTQDPYPKLEKGKRR